MLSEARRLHRLSWLFIAGSTAKSLIIPAIIVLVASRGNLSSSYEVWSLVFIVPTLAAALIKQGVYTYWFADEELVVRDGVLVRKERHIPYDRVHNVGLVQNPIHRILGVASVRVETASGGAPEAVMRVLSLDAVQELREHTLGRTPATTAGEADDETPADEVREDDTVLLYLPAGELVRLGLISNRGFILVAAASGLLWQASWWGIDWLPYYERLRNGARGWATWLVPGSVGARVLVGIAIVVLFVVLLRLFSVGWHLLKYYGFTLHREEDDLRTEYGLWTKVSTTIPAHRIQLLTTRATPLHRWFGRTSVDLETAGASAEGSDLQGELAASGIKTERQWLAPLVETDRTNSLLRDVLPEIDLDEIEWEPLAARARRRIIKRSVLALAVLTAAPSPLIGLHALWLPAVGLPLAVAYAYGFIRHAGYALTDRAVFFRSGWLSRKVSVVRFNKMQTVELTESPFDRRNRMTSVAVDTAGAGSVGHRIDIPYLDKDVAEGIARRLYAEASHTEYRW